jgi:hypothetical protein
MKVQGEIAEAVAALMLIKRTGMNEWTLKHTKTP